MSTTDAGGVTCDIAGLPGLVGVHLGYTDWQEMTQERVNLFADATDDHQFIHVDPERAKATPFGGTALLHVTDVKMGVNYGLDRVRFPAPLRVGAQWRGGAEIASVDQIDGGMQLKVVVTIEVQGSAKPAVVAESLVRVYG